MSRMKWTLEDHKKASAVLLAMDELLEEFFRGPLSESPLRIGRTLLRLDGVIGHLRSDLENEMCKSLKGQLPRDSTHVYYPRRDRPEVSHEG